KPQPPARAVRVRELADAGTCRRPPPGDGIAAACPNPFPSTTKPGSRAGVEGARQSPRRRPRAASARHDRHGPLISDSLVRARWSNMLAAVPVRTLVGSASLDYKTKHR